MEIKYLISVVQSKKTDYNTKITKNGKKITDHNHNEYIATPEFNNITAENFAKRLKEADLAAKTHFDDKLRSPNHKINSNKIKNLLVENKFKKLEIFDSIYIRDKSRFEEDGTQNYSAFKPMYRYFKLIANTKYISEWKCKGLSNESIKPPTTSDNSISPLIDCIGNKTRLKLNGSC